ncbi:MAG: hypothetical protein COU51_02030 [Parcubacteria group bacterium CG10_big_fil_rev_8_21_14_0_10_36_14]|nr:MAG: hypothetical protein COU51_02030 [Parcubacteria group bacterium CG10_big_fil_rev_8_21_14_0_10_36_14]
MPYQDGTGPEGKGPKTGRGLGRCTEKDQTIRPSINGLARQGTGRRPRRSSDRITGRGFGRKS